ncbi:DUF397 domain-containing protein [Streptomyces sp. NPDC059991]|uniref:DUF397 domain-containing protein n=1 Tax=Streptomyces sp. NPDC059991 TaxID=3347028 RepID=UPI00368D6CA5
MHRFENGMSADLMGEVGWTKSSHSNGAGSCVEVAALPGGDMAVRNSRFPGGPALIFTPSEARAFLAGAREGQFDFVTD